MTDTVAIRGLRVYAHHGVLAAERRDGQEFVLDATLELDTRPAAAGDDLAATVDYGALAGRLHAAAAADPVDLIETLADRLAGLCLADPRVHAATVTVHKPHAPVPLPFDEVAVTVRRAAPVVVLALGSNLGDRLAHLRAGLGVLARSLDVQAVSPVWETAPVGGPEQGAYLNAVLLARAPSAAAAWAAAQAAERSEGRERGVRFGPRTLDVDVVSVAGEVSVDPALTLPHPRAHTRAFVLAPWHDVDPAAVLPGYGAVADLLALRLAAGDEVTRRAELTLR